MNFWLKYRIPISFIGGMYVCLSEQKFNPILFGYGFLLTWLAYFTQSVFFIKKLQKNTNYLLLILALCVELLFFRQLNFQFRQYVLLACLTLTFAGYVGYLRQVFWIKSLIISTSWLIGLYIIPNVGKEISNTFLLSQFLLLATLCLFFDYKHKEEDQLSKDQINILKKLIIFGISLMVGTGLYFHSSIIAIFLIPFLLIIQFQFLDKIKTNWLYYTIDLLVILQFISG